MRPNVLLIVLDAARRDAFEPYGAPAGSTPAVAQLAARGAAHPRAYSTACWTVPSHASLFTGLLPEAAGLANPVSPEAARAGVVANTGRLLPEILRGSGYSTAAVSANAWVSRASGFDTGFDSFELVESGRQGRIHQPGARAQARWLAEALRARVDDGAEAARRALRGLAARRDERPFFWFVNLVEAHSPYLPPRPWNPLGPVGRLRAAAEARTHLTLRAIWETCAGEREIPADALERMRELYRGAIAYMDRWLAGVLEDLDEEGLLDDTLVIVTSDHGENLGEAGLITHALSLDQRLINVPFVSAGPGAPAGGDTPLSLASVPFLVAQATGVAGPWRADDLPQGVALAQQVAQLEPSDPRIEVVKAEWGMQDAAIARFQMALACAVDNHSKLLRRGEQLELYDLEADPGEERPRHVEPGTESIAALEGALSHPAMRRAAPVQPVQADTADEAERRDIEERMRLLGYL
jgi:arylsulfatase A-like enzyme